MIAHTNLGGLLQHCKNVNVFRSLLKTKLECVNLTGSGLQTSMIEPVVSALKQVPTLKKIVLAENFEVEFDRVEAMLRSRRVRAVVEGESIVFNR